MARVSESDILIKHQQFTICNKMGIIHYCQNLHLLRHRSEHTCASAVYYGMMPRGLHHSAMCDAFDEL